MTLMFHFFVSFNEFEKMTKMYSTRSFERLDLKLQENYAKTEITNLKIISGFS